MAIEWYVMVRDEVRGPFTVEQMRAAAGKGLIRPQTNVRKGEDGDWVRAATLKGLLPREEAPFVAAPEVVEESVEVPEDAGSDPWVESIEAPVRSYRTPRHRTNPVPVFVIAGIGLAILLGMLYWLSRPQKPTAPAETKQVMLDPSAETDTVRI